MTTIAGFIDGILDGTIPAGAPVRITCTSSDEVKPRVLSALC